jgi:pantoate--beta-alanine ligase
MTIPPVVFDAQELHHRVATWKKRGLSVAFVPTMGSLHEGHKALVRAASAQADRVVVSIFVNPLQFGVGEDFGSYPRGLDADKHFLSDTDTDVVFAPTPAEIYPAGADDTAQVLAGPVGKVFEGHARPGHFDGMLTVVARLLEIVAPGRVIMGRKDAQQMFLVQEMVEREGLRCAVIPVDTVRDSDGLALSSRNAYLSIKDRVIAGAIPRALEAAVHTDSLEQALARSREELQADPALVLDYLSVVDPATFTPLKREVAGGEGLMIVAAKVGTTRLIDNTRLTFGH